MATVSLTLDESRRLVRLIATRAGVLTPLQRENLLDAAGLHRFVTKLHLDAPAADFAPELVRVLQDHGTLAETGQPALVSLLRELRAIVAGHEDEVAFLDTVLAPYAPNGALPPPAAPAAPPLSSPVTSTPELPAPIPDPAYEACLEEAARRAQRQLYGTLGCALLLFVPVAVALVMWWAVLEPVTYVLGVLLFLAGAIYYARTGYFPSVERLHNWLQKRERLRCGEPPSVSPAPTPTQGVTPGLPLATQPTRRALELAFLRARRDLKQFDPADVFTTLAGQTRPHMHPRFDHREEFRDGGAVQEGPPRSFEDIVGEMGQIQRAVVLGEPGAGKTTTLRKLEVDAIERALKEQTVPLPLFVPLKAWVEPAQPLWTFVREQAGTLAPHLDALLGEGRLLLLLDGLDQVPAEQREEKVLEVKKWLADHRDTPVVVSSRLLEYGRMVLGVDRIEIAPLDPERIRDYLRRYLAVLHPDDARAARAQAESLWQSLGGSDALLSFWRKVVKHGEPQRFWQLGAGVPGYTTGAEDEAWRAMPGRMIALASNPYMLLMMIDVYEEDGQLPANRSELFARFVRRLLAREGLTERDPLTDEVRVSALGEQLVVALRRLAYEMQRQRAQAERWRGRVVTMVWQAVVPVFLSEEQLHRARSATLLASGDPISFSHQLLQEYFAAVEMDAEIRAGRLEAEALWPREQWWEATGWQEATVLYAGLQSSDCTEALRWVAGANPEVAATCLTRSGAAVLPATREWLRELWLPRLIDLKREPHPYGRAAVGRALAEAGLDNRRGVGVSADGLPDIAWVKLEGGSFPVGGDNEAYNSLPARQVQLAPFAIARYPVTNQQWDAFLQAADGYVNDAWWQGLAGGKQEPVPPRWSHGNHPRERVNWYEAMAFCQWLTERLGLRGSGEEVRLPTEAEWERAARGEAGRVYPWEGEYESGIANIHETVGKVGSYYLQQTSTVGIYPQGATPESICDLSGNVWEWTLTEYGNGVIDIKPSAARVLRGGSWHANRRDARAASRNRRDPHYRDNNLGFRVDRASPPGSGL